MSEDLVTLFRLQASPDAVDIDVYDMIGDSYGGGVSAKDVMVRLREMPLAREIRMRINSPGGRITEGMAIYSLLAERKRSGAKCNVTIDGIAASMASLLAMLGDEIRIAKGGFMMIHNPRGAVMGEAKDLRRGAEILDKMRETVIDIYSSKTGRDKEEIGKWMDDETWMTAAEAVERGFASEVTGDIQAAACADLLTFVGAPSHVVVGPAPRFNSGGGAPSDQQKGNSMVFSPVVLGALQMSADVTETQVAGEISRLRQRETLLTSLEASLGASGGALAGKVEALKESAAEAAQLRVQLEAKQREAAAATVTALLDKAAMEGRLPPAKREKAQRMFDKFGMEALQEYMSDLPVVAGTAPTAKPVAAESTQLTDAQLRVYASMGISREQAIKIEEEDRKASKESF